MSIVHFANARTVRASGKGLIGVLDRNPPLLRHKILGEDLSSSGRKFHKRREGGEAGTEREEHPFLAGLWPAAVQDLP